MRPPLRTAFESELTLAEGPIARDRAWHHLERAHVLSQAYAWPHLRVHVCMLAFAWRHRLVREFLGQLPRILLAMPGSWIGRAPLGNTGGANVGIFTPMPVPAELQELLEPKPPRP